MVHELHGECEAACPKDISIDFIAHMNRDYVKAKFENRRLESQRGLTSSPTVCAIGPL